TGGHASPPSSPPPWPGARRRPDTGDPGPARGAGPKRTMTSRRLAIGGGRDRRRSGDLPLFRRTLCQLSYPTKRSAPGGGGAVAVPTGFEPAASGLTGRRALQTAPRDLDL